MGLRGGGWDVEACYLGCEEGEGTGSGGDRFAVMPKGSLVFVGNTGEVLAVVGHEKVDLGASRVLAVDRFVAGDED